ncbi:hypothetical protein [Halococcoides cellulosivorans]|uniref:Uncharacterized protein n=1 Tax=Halococcoides cellulosivorans TaxID=1679096 RepID=A0A2R4X3V4_9EURY|nr:hypothetical protein [Halococcoides cellulosivorans]AWB28467.1 hypothetical protein HARCEL1_12530 [Halococcoides cellulosivorans]
MPINEDSEEWKEGRRLDPLQVHISNILRRNDEQAFTLEEITDHIIEDEADALFLLDSVDEEQALEEVDEETYGLIKSRIAMKLEDLGWRNFIEWKVIGYEDADIGTVYFTNSDKESVSPIAKIVDVYPRKFSSIEEDIEDLADDVEELQYGVNNLRGENY